MISEGVAIGEILLIRKSSHTVAKEKCADTKTEILRLEAAKQKAIEELTELYEITRKKTGAEDASVFHVHQMLLADEEYNGFLYQYIEEKSNCRVWGLCYRELFCCNV